MPAGRFDGRRSPCRESGKEKGDNRLFLWKKGTADSRELGATATDCPLYSAKMAVVPFFGPERNGLE